jgi:hypothetical protein
MSEQMKAIGDLVQWFTEATDAVVNFRLHCTREPALFQAEVYYFNHEYSQGVICRGEWKKTATAAVASMLKDAPRTGAAAKKLAEYVVRGADQRDGFKPNDPPGEDDYESNPAPPAVVEAVHDALAALNPSSLEEWAGGVWGFKLPGDAVSAGHAALKALGGWRTLAKLPSGVNMRKGRVEAQLSKSPHAAYTQVIVDTKPDYEGNARNPQGYEIPAGLSEAGREAAEAIVAFLTAQDELGSGGAKVFYSPAEWAARGEESGLESELIVTHDGGNHAIYFSHDYQAYDAMEEMRKELQRVGVWVEQQTSWYSAIYPLDPPQRGRRK